MSDHKSLLGPGPPGPGARVKKTRIRLDQFTTAWMVVALAVGVLTVFGRLSTSAAWWLSIHMITLGVLTNSILQWSWYFARSLLRLPRAHRGAGPEQTWRLVTFNLMLVATTFGMIWQNLFTVLIGATGIGVVLAWHGLALLQAARSQLGSKFAVIIRYYLAASASLVLGCVLGGFIAVTMFDSGAPLWLAQLRLPLTVAHALINGLGWIGLSIAGTLVTLGPTMLRTRIVPGAVIRAYRALPYAFGCVLAAALAILGGFASLAGGFVLIYVALLGWSVGYPLLEEAVVKAPRSFASYSVSAGLVWSAVAGVGLGLALVFGELPGYESTRSAVLVIAAAAGVLQILAGALTYLMPVAIGRGPRAVKVGIAALEWGGIFRVTLRNLALACAVVTMAPLWWVVVALTYGADLVIFAVAGIKQSRAGKLYEGRQ